MPKPRADLKPNTLDYENLPLVTPNGFREYDARWLFGTELNLPGVQALGLGLGTLFHELGIAPRVSATFLRHADARRPPGQREHAPRSRAS